LRSASGAAIIGGIVLSEAALAEHRSTPRRRDRESRAQTYRSVRAEHGGCAPSYDGVRRTYL
jgi:hypothetical protein